MGWIKDIYEFHKLRRELKRIYKDTDIIERLSATYGSNFRADRAGRLYAVFCPLLMNLKTNNSSQIYEYTTSGMSDATWLGKYVTEHMMPAEKALIESGLADALKFKITQCYYDNQPTRSYLLQFVPYNFEDYVNSKKKLIILLSIVLVVLLIASITLALCL